MSDRADLHPSLLERQARGGDEAQRGITFQTNVLLSRLPLWLSHERFTMLTQESMGDIEVRFFEPGLGVRLELLEAKNHIVTPSEFWDEIQQFSELHKGSPGLYQRFELACTGFAPDVQPVVNALRRLRGPSGMYPEGSAVVSNSFEDYAKLIRARNHTDEEARFIHDMVDLSGDLSSAQDNGQALFKDAFALHLPQYDLRSQTLTSIYNSVNELLRQRVNKVVKRAELETRIRERVDEADLPPLDPIRIHTLHQEENYEEKAICFDWTEFFGGNGRTYPPSDEWEARLLSPLRQTKQWVDNHRNIRRIRLSGNRRLSAALAFGFTFPATAGFQIDMEYRDEIWSTDYRVAASSVPYPIEVTNGSGTSGELIVSIGIIHCISGEVERYASSVGLGSASNLHIYGTGHITSPQQANPTSAVQRAERLNLSVIGPLVRKKFALHLHGFQMRRQV